MNIIALAALLALLLLVALIIAFQQWWDRWLP